MEAWAILLLSTVALCGLALIAFLCWATFLGAVLLFGFAAEQGFVGLAAYVACWIFLFPFMLVACVLFGIGVLIAMKEERRAAKEKQEIPLTRQRLGLDP